LDGLFALHNPQDYNPTCPSN